MSQSRLWHKVLAGCLLFAASAIFSYPFFQAWQDSFVVVQPVPTATQIATSSVAVTAYAMVWVDDLTKSDPLIEAVWIAWVPANFSVIELDYLPLAAGDRRFSPEQSGLSLDSLPPQVRNGFGGSIALDHADLGAVADLVGGIPIGGQTLKAADLKTYLTIGPTDTPDEIMIRQAAVMQGLIAQLTLLGRNLSMRDILSIPKHKTIDDAVLDGLVYQYYPLQLEAVHVRLNPRGDP